MSSDTWQKGYKEIKNIIHNDIGISKDEILNVFREMAKEEVKKVINDELLDIFREIAREELKDITSGETYFIRSSIREVIRDQMIDAIQDHRYPKVSGHTFFYGYNGKGEHSFKDYVSGLMKEEISNMLRSQFDIKLNIDVKNNTDI